jgi:hypothetical protein
MKRVDGANHRRGDVSPVSRADNLKQRAPLKINIICPPNRYCSESDQVVRIRKWSVYGTWIENGLVIRKRM